MNHRIGRAVFALGTGLLVAYLSFNWITSPEGRLERAAQEAAVMESRDHLTAVVGARSLVFVDPLAPNRKVGKVYVYREGDGWAISGFYRRGDADSWHPYLLYLGAESDITSLKIQDSDPALLQRAAADPAIEVLP